MGYYSILHLVNIKIKDESLPVVNKVLQTKKGRGLTHIRYFFDLLVVDEFQNLCFKSDEDDPNPAYVPDEEDGTVPALHGKWKKSEEFAKWLKLHSEKGGMLIHHGMEGDGAAWGWHFDGRGRMRELALCSVGKWT